MVNIVFEDSFEGFLSALYYAFRNKIQNPIFSKTKTYSIFNTVVIDSEEDILKRVATLLDKDTIELFYDCYCFDEKEAFVDTYKSFLFYLENHHLKDINKDFIRNLYYYKKSVNRERHKYSGFLRFSEIEDILYAKFSPKHFVLDYLGYFFKNRYKNAKFIIHDIKRQKAFVYDKTTSYIGDFKEELNQENDIYHKLWKIFFESVSIKERENKRLQAQYVPKHYRKFMIEFH